MSPESCRADRGSAENRCVRFHFRDLDVRMLALRRSANLDRQRRRLLGMRFLSHRRVGCPPGETVGSVQAVATRIRRADYSVRGLAPQSGAISGRGVEPPLRPAPAAE
jgi:hypothetical protein